MVFAAGFLEHFERGDSRGKSTKPQLRNSVAGSTRKLSIENAQLTAPYRKWQPADSQAHHFRTAATVHTVKVNTLKV